MSSKLFAPLQLGKAKLSHRMAMAPLTRFRADDNHVPLPMVKTYYEQRGSVPGTLIISEATIISPQAGGYANVPGIYTEDQVKAWKEITDAVHAKGSYIYCQLWALGRTADPNVLKSKGLKLVSASAIPMDDKSATPEALTEEQIHSYIADYANAAKNAIKAGFDGVEVHGANGYLVDQFTQDKSNQRTDSWGGSVENRSKFAISVVEAVVAAVGAERAAIRLSPFSDFQGMHMADPYPQFTYLTNHLKTLNLSYLHVVESRISGSADAEATDKIDFLAKIWAKTSPFLVAGGFTAESAKKVVDEYPDNDVVVVFGRYFIPNPDLPFRVKEGIPLTKYDRNTFYNAGEAKGYIDWPFSKEFETSTKA